MQQGERSPQLICTNTSRSQRSPQESAYDQAEFRKSSLAGLLVLVVLLGIWEFIRLHGWTWFLLPACLITGGWIALGVYTDHLIGHGRYDQALRLVPLLVLSRVGRSRLQANFLTDAGRYEDAERILRKIVDRVIGVKLKNIARVRACLDLENLGEVLIEAGRFEEAQRCFRQAAGMGPHHSGWATLKAEALLRQGIFSQSALAHAERALNLFQRGAERFISSSRLAGILATKAWALAACGREMEAREAIDAALKSSAGRKRRTFAEVHYKVGRSLIALLDRRGAEEYFTRGAQIDPAGRWGRLCVGALEQRQTNSSP